MRKKFDEQLEHLNQELILMGTMVEENIQESIDALMKQDVELAKEIMAKDVSVDRKQKDIEGICFGLLIQQQPVARDLRAITAAMKMVTDMERIGDHAADISEMTILMCAGFEEKEAEGKTKNGFAEYHLNTVVQMAAQASQMLIKSIEAFVEKDVIKAREVIDHDDVVDALFDKQKRELVELIREDPKSGEQEIDTLMIAKYLERIADHATNLSEWVIYAVEGEGEF